MKQQAENKETDTLQGAAPDQVIQNEMMRIMLRSISEDFNRPIGLIMHNCEYLQSHLSREKEAYNAEKVEGALHDISSTTIHLNRLVENFVEMTASMNGVLQPEQQMLDLAAMLKDICADTKEIYQAIGVELQVDVSKVPHALVVADRTFAERICLNLLSNALHACAAGEHVCFTLEEGENGFGITVTDDGYGFPPEDILVAFAPFQGHTGMKPKGFERGSGLGL